MYNKQLNDQCTRIFKEVIKGKRVLFVGNSASLFSDDSFGATIDSYDFVLRFGKGWPDPIDAAYLGTKTNAWFFGAGRAGMYKHFKDVPWKIYTPSQLKVYEPGQDQLVNHMMMDGTMQPYRDYFMTGSSKEVVALNKKVNGNETNARLSQGIQAIDWITTKANSYKSLTLIGFDFFANEFSYSFDNKHHPSIPSNHISSSWHCPLVSKHYECNPHFKGSDGVSNELKYIISNPDVGVIQMPPIDYDKMNEVLKRLRGKNSEIQR